MAEQLANLARSTLTTPLTSGGTSLTVAAGEGARFPATGDFRVTIDPTGATPEIVKCTGRTGDVLTVVRGDGGTVARAWQATTRVVHSLTAESVTALIAAGGGGGGGSSAATAGFSLHMTASAPLTADSLVPFNAALYDTDGFLNATVSYPAPGIVIPAGLGGVYLIQTTIYLDDAAAFDTRTPIAIVDVGSVLFGSGGGTPFDFPLTQILHGSQRWIGNGTYLVPLDVGDWLNVLVILGAGFPGLVNGEGIGETTLTGQRLGPMPA